MVIVARKEKKRKRAVSFNISKERRENRFIRNLRTLSFCLQLDCSHCFVSLEKNSAFHYRVLNTGIIPTRVHNIGRILSYGIKILLSGNMRTFLLRGKNLLSLSEAGEGREPTVA